MNSKRVLILFTIILLLSLFITVPAPPGMFLDFNSAVHADTKNKSCLIKVLTAYNKPVLLTVEIADTEKNRNVGLMHRKQLGTGHGMLFVFPREQMLTFWMKNTYLPLSIAYIGEENSINEIYDMKPLDTSVVYPSRLPARYALEVNRGWFAKNNITRGCTIIFNGCLSK